MVHAIYLGIHGWHRYVFHHERQPGRSEPQTQPETRNAAAQARLRVRGGPITFP